MAKLQTKPPHHRPEAPKANASKQTMLNIDSLVANPELPKFYANNFVCALGIGDIALVFRNTNHEVAMCNMSYTAAKSLAIKLQEVVTHLESKSEHTIMTSDEISKYLSKS